MPTSLPSLQWKVLGAARGLAEVGAVAASAWNAPLVANVLFGLNEGERSDLVKMPLGFPCGFGR